MNLFIIRHGQTDLNKKKVFQGSLDVQLNDIGIEQAKELSLSLKYSKIDLIFSSPLQRALDTAKIINEYHNSPIIVSDLIIERSLGKLEGNSLPTEKFIELQHEICDLSNVKNRPYDVESLDSILNRARTFLNGIINDYGNTDKNIYIIAHGFLNLILLFLLGEVDSSELFDFAMKNCFCYKIENPSIKNI